MKRSGWLRPSPALVVACLALFVALGGTVLAATKIDGKTIKVKSLPGNRLEPGSMPGNRIAPGSVNGNRIKADTMGEVPSAAHAGSADSARHADTATAADHATDATTINGHPIGCAPGRRQYAGACWDMQPHFTAVNVIEAAAACAAEGGELPPLISLVTFTLQPGSALFSQGEWVNQVSTLGDEALGIAVLSSGRLFVGSPQKQFNFRCVTPLVS
jgi:hypothetical protein